jgi:hypothetical protein
MIKIIVSLYPAPRTSTIYFYPFREIDSNILIIQSIYTIININTYLGI